MTQEVAAEMLASIEGDRLMVFCGAGLSFPAPSNLPSAAQVARQCYDRYRDDLGTMLPADHRDDLEKLSKYFYEHNQLEATLIGLLVRWSDFDTTPNHGHRAVADLLACGAFQTAITTNYDLLVESAAKALGEPDFRSVVEAGDLNGPTPHAPFLKLHGCAVRSRRQTVWCVEQLSREPLLSRLAAFRTWLEAALQQRDLVFIGFWSDWAYLNRALTDAVVGTEPRSVTIVAPVDAAALQAKAPALWTWANSGAVSFRHVSESGETFLEELRERFSQHLLTRIIHNSTLDFEHNFGGAGGGPAAAAPAAPAPAPPADGLHGLSADDLYALRRAFDGQPTNAPSRSKRPEPSHSLVGMTHLFLRSKGAVFRSGAYDVAGKRVRLLSTPGQLLSRAKARFASEPPTLPVADETVCAGAREDLSPAHIIRPGAAGHIIRGGTGGRWITDGTFFAENR